MAIASPPGAPIDEHRVQYEGWRVVAACAVGTFFATVPLNTFAVFLRPVSEHFSWSREAASSAFGTLTLVAAFSAPWIGRLLDRFGARRIIVPALALSGCAVASLSLLTASVWHLRLVFAALGLATLGAATIGPSRAIFGWFDALRGRALGLTLTGSALSGIVTPPAAQALIHANGWRIAWLVCGLATVLAALPAAVVFIRDRGVEKNQATAASSGASVREAVRTRAFWTLVVVLFGGTIATSGAFVHIVALLVDRGVSAGGGAVAVSAIGFASLVGRLLTGWMIDRLDAARVSAALLTTAAIGVFLLAGAHSLWTGVIAALLIGFGAGGEIDVTPYLLSRHFGLRSFATLYGFNWTAWGLAGALGAMVLGRAFDATGSYALTLIELGIATLVSAGLMLTLPAAPPRLKTGGEGPA
jgi:MFS family permease